MNWMLFCQIEVILLTIGLVISFVISMHQAAKDNSFFKRIGSVSKLMADATSAIAERMTKKENDDDE